MTKIKYKFKDELEVLQYVIQEVKRYTGAKSLSQVLYSYNRLTVEELGQEVYVKILRSVQPEGLSKTYIRQAVIFVCIDEYRRYRLVDPIETSSDSEESIDREDLLESPETYGFELTERLMNLEMFEPKELEVILLLIEGKRNPEIREELNIPKMSYYTLLNRLKRKYTEILDETKYP